MSFKIEAKIKDNGLIGRLKDYPEIQEREGRRFLEISLNLVQRLVKAFTPVGATGLLRGSIFITEITGSVKSLQGSVTTTSVYGGAVENGTKAHMPPVEPLILWVRRTKKALISQENAFGSMAIAIQKSIAKKGRKPPPVGVLLRWILEDTDITPSREFRIKSTAWAIAMKIKASGTKGAFMFKKGLKKAQPTISKERDTMLKRIAEAVEKG